MVGFSKPMRPWSDRPIHDNGEPLVALPPTLLRLEPHPYVAAGAPYGPGADPFQLRSGVVDRLLACLLYTSPSPRDP